MDDRTAVIDVTVKRDESVTVVYADGRSCSFGLTELRVNCPCASCRNARDQGRRPWEPRPGVALAISDAELVGAWGLSITWNDGHSTGIFPWESLRQWCDEGEPAFSPDSGLGS